MSSNPTTAARIAHAVFMTVVWLTTAFLAALVAVGPWLPPHPFPLLARIFFDFAVLLAITGGISGCLAGRAADRAYAERHGWQQ